MISRRTTHRPTFASPARYLLTWLRRYTVSSSPGSCSTVHICFLRNVELAALILKPNVSAVRYLPAWFTSPTFHCWPAAAAPRPPPPPPNLAPFIVVVAGQTGLQQRGWSATTLAQYTLSQSSYSAMSLLPYSLHAATKPTLSSELSRAFVMSE